MILDLMIILFCTNCTLVFDIWFWLILEKWVWSVVDTQGDVPNIDSKYATREYVCYDDGYLYLLSPIVERHGVVNTVHCYRLNNSFVFFVVYVVRELELGIVPLFL